VPDGRARAERPASIVSRKRCARIPSRFLLFGVSIALLIVTMVARRVALTAIRRQDLTFGGTLEELELVLSNGGRSARDVSSTRRCSSSGRASRRHDRNPRRSRRRTGGAPGGFICGPGRAVQRPRDPAGAGRGDAREHARTGVTEAPSLLRSVRTETGERRLSERPNPFALTVRSPYAERTWREVRTGLEQQRRPARPRWRRRTGRGRRRSQPRAAERTRLHDPSQRTAAAAVLRHRARVGCQPLLRRRVRAESGDPRSARTHAFAVPARHALAQWRVRSFTEGDVRAGDVFDVERTGPFMLSVSERGTLAAGQWINGRQSFSNQRLGTISFFGAAGRASGGSVHRSARALARRIAVDRPGGRGTALHASAAGTARMSVVIMDVRTGELKAIAEPARRSDGEALLAFEPLLVGSVVKPLVASAILARQPQLAELTLNYAGDTVRVVANVPLERGFANAANGCAGGIAFTDFIRCSSNQYAAELLVRSLRADG
jgi:hypothetical protein